MMRLFPRRLSVRLPLLGVAGLVLLGLGVGCCSFSAPRYQGKASGAFDGRRFHNQQPIVRHGFPQLLRWQLRRQRGPWRELAEARPGPPPPPRVTGAPRVTFVNHSTVLLQMDGLNILTDPIWSRRASPVTWAGPRRMRPPGIRFSDLPRIDLVLVSHNHYDHLDLATLEALQRRDSPLFVVGLGNGALLESKRIGPVAELRWWASLPVRRGVRVHAVPAQHFSQRGLCDRDGTLWAGYVVEGPSGAIYFAGDTGPGPHFVEIGKRFRLRLAMLPIGAFRPRWFMGPVHLSPERAVEAHQQLRAERSLAIHFGTFALGDDGQDEPPQLLRETMRARGVETDLFWVLAFGEGRTLPESRSRKLE